MHTAYYLIRAQDIHDNCSPASNQLRVIITGVSKEENGIPTTYALYQSYPNPFNPSATIRDDVPTSGWVTLKVYDMLGREVETLVDGVDPPRGISQSALMQSPFRLEFTLTG